MQLEEFTFEELELQHGELLPDREAMALVNVANVTGVNLALALNTASFQSAAYASAGQYISVWQG
jgi:hypothetical protein